jgi:hypothetical protein
VVTIKATMSQLELILEQKIGSVDVIGIINIIEVFG